MKDNNLAKAYTEVVELLSYLPYEEYNKIPKEKIFFFFENRDMEYVFTISPEIDLSEQNISKDAFAIITTLYEDYIATEKQKNTLNDILILNDEKSKKEKNQEFDADGLFKKNVVNVTKTDVPTVIQKEKFFVRFKKFIARFFK